MLQIKVVEKIKTHISRSITFFYSKIIVIVFLHGLGRLTCSGIDALPSFPGVARTRLIFILYVYCVSCLFYFFMFEREAVTRNILDRMVADIA